MLVILIIQIAGTALLIRACWLFLRVFYHSWYSGQPRRFWLSRLTYYDNEELHSKIRSAWKKAWIFAFAGSFMVMFNHPMVRMSLLWLLYQMVYLVIVVWVIAKLIIGIRILPQLLMEILLRMRNLLFRNSSFLSKHEITQQKPN